MTNWRTARVQLISSIYHRNNLAAGSACVVHLHSSRLSWFCSSCCCCLTVQIKEDLFVLHFPFVFGSSNSNTVWEDTHCAPFEHSFAHLKFLCESKCSNRGERLSPRNGLLLRTAQQPALRMLASGHDVVSFRFRRRFANQKNKRGTSFAREH